MTDVQFKAVSDDAFTLIDAYHGVEFHLSRVHRRGATLLGELTVAAGLVGTKAVDGKLLSASFSLTNLRERQDWARMLADRSRTAKIDWAG